MFGSEMLAGVALTTLPSVRMPGSILGPIAGLMGYVYNMLFDGLHGMMSVGVLGVAIIIFTLIVKIILFPLMVKQQKSSFKMQLLQPELDKIKNKYKGKSDQLSQQKMAMEMQDFQKKNGINLMGGCLPLLVQLPILYALFFLFQNAYVYVDVIGQNYTEIANAILQIPEGLRMEVFGPYAQTFVDAYKKVDIIKAGGFDLSRVGDIVMLVNYLGVDDWTTIMSQLGAHGNGLVELLAAKNNIETFLTIPLVSTAGLTWPGVIIPVMAAISTFAQSKIMMVMTPSANADPNNPAMAMTKTMTYVMPFMMGFFCISMPAGLGLYWTISNIFGIIQQVILQKYYKKKFMGEAAQNG
ncbi:YidC/Oxa1 family membrane protein insertase [Anaerotignum sp. MB30-C6]|uniref:YidC/Oxa1 family membrane protein insertase n=1 Tax=Anaerotignum sp. MB30-C6 TaxID=3070814 RepID=UPI0027DB8E3B|nr:YidC/Oxa1 family membrane protein insertase [Anaerotignum sp. MB30-C6]WMI81144.1 YidC/Oxa1 family membrane protein insertase [Anaerotignum sp. MB30-C6]